MSFGIFLFIMMFCKLVNMLIEFVDRFYFRMKNGFFFCFVDHGDVSSFVVGRFFSIMSFLGLLVFY